MRVALSRLIMLFLLLCGVGAFTVAAAMPESDPVAVYSDQAFVEVALAHQRATLTLAEKTLPQAFDPLVLLMAGGIVRDQPGFAARLEAIALSLPPHRAQRPWGMTERLNGLEEAIWDKDPDRNFAALLLAMDIEAVDAAFEAVRGSTRPDVLAAAEAIIRNQGQRITVLQWWVEADRNL